jgi:hypothetical protein
VIRLLLTLGLPAPAAETVQQFDFSAGAGALSPGGDVGTSWQWGVVDSGPGAGLGGDAAWGTVLAGDYLNDASETLELPPLSVGGLAAPALGLTHWYAIDATGAGDVGVVEVWDGGAWLPVEPIYGYPVPQGFQGHSGEWTTSWFDLRGLGDPVSVRLRLSSDLAVVDDGWYLGAAELVDGDAAPPRVVVLEAPSDRQDLAEGAHVEAEIDDDRGVATATVVWVDDAGGAGVVEMAEVGAAWTADLPPREPDTSVDWHIEARDDADNLAQTAPHSFRTYLAAPTDLQGPSGAVAASTVRLSWQAPVAPYPVLSYAVLRENEVVAEVTETTALAPLVDGAPRFAVEAIFDTPLGVRAGDASAAIAIDAAVPRVDPPQPDAGWGGDVLRLVVTGENLLLTAGQVSLRLGDGVTVRDLEVRDVGTLLATIEIDAAATTGPRELTLRSGDESLTSADAFVVRAAADRPRVRSATPDRLRRGAIATVILETAGGLSSDAPEVWLGPGVVVEQVEVDGDAVAVQVAVANDAPLGAHAIEIDDGVRLLTGPTLEVLRPAAETQRSCSAAGGPAGLALAALGGLLMAPLRRRQRARRGPASTVNSRSTKP